MQAKSMLGIDVGGSGIKGAIVDLETGKLLSDRIRLETPKPSKPEAVRKVFAELVKKLKWKGPIGVGFPSVMKDGVAYTAANIHKDWVGTNAARLLSDATDSPVIIANDADLAGIAEMKFGNGKGVNGTVILITIGSGLGSALFYNGRLVPNTEFGHFFLKGHKKIVEHYASDGVRKAEELSWKSWAERFNEYLKLLERLFSPDLILLGGGASKKYDIYNNYLKSKMTVVPAQLRNNAGIIGAALLANQTFGKSKKK